MYIYMARIGSAPPDGTCALACVRERLGMCVGGEKIGTRV